MNSLLARRRKRIFSDQKSMRRRFSFLFPLRCFSCFKPKCSLSVGRVVCEVCLRPQQQTWTIVRGGGGLGRHWQWHIVWKETLCSSDPLLMPRPWSYIHTMVMCCGMSCTICLQLCYGFRLTGRKVCDANSLCNMSSDKLASHYPAGIHFVFVACV